MTASHDFLEGLYLVKLTVTDSAGVLGERHLTRRYWRSVAARDDDDCRDELHWRPLCNSTTATGAIPADLTLFFQLLTQSAHAPIGLTSLLPEALRFVAQADSTYTVHGTFITATAPVPARSTRRLVGTISPSLADGKTSRGL